jgi:hypothetical protein
VHIGDVAVTVGTSVEILGAKAVLSSGATISAGNPVTFTLGNSTTAGTLQFTGTTTGGFANGFDLGSQNYPFNTFKVGTFGGTFDVVDSAQKVTVWDKVSGDGKITKSGDGKLVFANDVAFHTLNVDKGTVVFTNNPLAKDTLGVSDPINTTYLTFDNTTGIPATATITGGATVQIFDTVVVGAKDTASATPAPVTFNLGGSGTGNTGTLQFSTDSGTSALPSEYELGGNAAGYNAINVGSAGGTFKVDANLKVFISDTVNGASETVT